ncbi:hypothetical protein D9757_002594 [Collybiopsis confluens]|uniref:Uncharacterized protein n=1 Tax=Collybiopsis confluens TaxID=2823264 RepID=A0A8H5HWC5_9AGAR|nr:hypothetical protein D9757_002594 [Collybiopsis confluens]
MYRDIVGANVGENIPSPGDYVQQIASINSLPTLLKRFPNWTPGQVEHAGIARVTETYDPNSANCTIYYVNVDTEGRFTNSEEERIEERNKEEFWDHFAHETRPPNLRVRALFIENLTGPVLQMLGAKFNIEPFFFSSSLSWIPSRFQEEVRPGKGDHITITLTFLRTVREPKSKESFGARASSISSSSTEFDEKNVTHSMINTQAPLLIGKDDKYMLVLDLLAVHLIRRNDGLGSTIISYHDTNEYSTSARYLHERIRFAGQSVYWQSIFQKSPDPTFVLLTYLWHCLYGWDLSLEKLYSHISWMASSSQMIEHDMDLTRSLHTIQAHLLHYSSLLEDFRKSIKFIVDTPNPAMESIPEEERLMSRKLLEKECSNLLIEVERLEKSRLMQERRLKNVMNLVFSTVNILDSKRMQNLTEAAVRDSAAMKQIAYLSMTFLPASFVATVFGMNVKELNSAMGTLAQYFAAAFSLTAVTIWIVIAFQSKHLFKSQDATSFWQRLTWPVIFIKRLLTRKEKVEDGLSLEPWNISGSGRRNPSFGLA